MTIPRRPVTARLHLHRLGVALALLAPAALAAQISIPLGGPKKERPSPNADLRGAPADIAAAVATRGRSAAMRERDRARHPAEVLDYFGLTRGGRVLIVERDLGYFGTIVGAAIGPDGRATELVAPDAMADPAVRATMSDAISLAPNLSIRVATARLTPGGFDFVLVDRAAPVAPDAAALFAAVRAGGIVGVVGGGDAAGATRDYTAAGFVLDRSGHLAGDSEAGDGRRFILKLRKPE